ncbi:DUF3500 domain-containing protein [candidate division KSB1 bacterium]|nr:DUF3500 domain-containing protein [candidate division KSB1 bacterium]NIR69166.1 DUF3500 domain-containing protein [candidate division KSB1 bacterium]NIS25677.1 DUF3500 domain-containing protein [candidate division KSB1 bacterium]NIT72545.1 DUF3500 domain-containing protein [candidate division KSB1 bacterium]NIU26354.1 DUF3500 domain-containing protein [candidate division KSB1 bacterium]
MVVRNQITCPDCEPAAGSKYEMPNSTGLSRREFLRKTSKAAVVFTVAPYIVTLPPALARGPNEPAEKMVKALKDSLSREQRKLLLLRWDDSRRLRVDNNWRVVSQRVGQIYSSDQKEMIRAILKGVTSEEGYEKIMRAMKDDMGGLQNYSACLFDDGHDKLSFVLSGRHQTIRADGGAEKNAVFGGPLFYGHAVEFYERPDHPGNVWWHQSRLASKVYYALDGNQQEKALVRRESPADRSSTVRLQGENGEFAGIPVSQLSDDQKALVEYVLRALLEPYRESDVEEAMTAIKANGGLDKLHISFYKDGDLPDKDGIWDRWKLEGPAFVWYFRGSPHVHTWINIAHKAERSA